MGRGLWSDEYKLACVSPVLFEVDKPTCQATTDTHDQVSSKHAEKRETDTPPDFPLFKEE